MVGLAVDTVLSAQAVKTARAGSEPDGEYRGRLITRWGKEERALWRVGTVCSR